MLNNKEYLNKIFQSNKPLIIYKTVGGYDVYTDYKEKIALNSKNIKNFSPEELLKLSKSAYAPEIGYTKFKGIQPEAFAGVKTKAQLGKAIISQLKEGKNLS